MTERAIQSKGFIKCWNELPETRGLLCYNLNNSANAIQGAQNKQLGLQPFRSDLTFHWESTTTFIEVKTPEGKQTKGQVNWEKLVLKHGFKYYLARSPQRIFNIVKKIARGQTRTTKTYK